VLALAFAAVLVVTPPADALRRPQDGGLRAALDLLYDGRPDDARRALADARAKAPRDAVGAYLEALVEVWRLEQKPPSAAADRAFLERADEAVRFAERALAADPGDLRALLARGATQGVRSRFHLFRGQRTDAARAAARMRADLLRVREGVPASADAAFGIGLYDYYADVLSRFAKVLRFLAGLPGGDRVRGLALIESAGEGSLFHDDEVQAQLYEIYAFYEDRPDRALSEARGMRRRHPGWPLWGLRLAEHLRERMGLYAESARVARELVEAAERGNINYRGAALVQARVSLGESLRLDLRFADARRELLAVKDGSPELAPTVARARLLLGRCLESEGDREGAVAHYRRAAQAADRAVRREAEAALKTPMPAGEVEGLALVAQARRLHEAGRQRDAAETYRRALRAWPASREAALLAAEDEILHGDPERARDAVEEALAVERPQPPWLRPWASLLNAQLLDVAGQRERAVVEYKKVLDRPLGRGDLRERAEDGVRRPFRARGSSVNTN
jgi:tetratricopeptide (TPR) repeat protein